MLFFHRLWLYVLLLRSTCIKMKEETQIIALINFMFHNFAASKKLHLFHHHHHRYCVSCECVWRRKNREIRKSLCDVIKEQKIKCSGSLFCCLWTSFECSNFFPLDTVEIGKMSIISQFNLAAFFQLRSFIYFALLVFVSLPPESCSVAVSRKKQRFICLRGWNWRRAEKELHNPVYKKIETRYFSIKNFFFNFPQKKKPWDDRNSVSVLEQNLIARLDKLYLALSELEAELLPQTFHVFVFLVVARKHISPRFISLFAFRKSSVEISKFPLLR